jgi:protease-4
MDALKSIFSWLGKFLEKTRVVLLNVATAFILIVITVAIMGGIFGGDTKIDKEGKVVFLDPAAVITDEEAFADSLFANTDVNQMTFRDFEDLVNELADDEEITAIVIDFSSTGFAGPTTLLNVAGLMKKLQASDIELIAYSDYFNTPAYLIASYADEIWGHSSGSFGLRGPGGYRPYLNELLTKNLKFTIHDFSEGTFKSAGETITRSSMSDFERKQTKELLDPIWTEMKSLIAKQRAMSIDDVQDFADKYSAGLLGEANYINLSAATEIGFIDGVKSYPEFREHMIEKFGLDEDSDRDTYPNISYQEYMDTYEIEKDSADNKVAVVTVEGTITRGEIQPGVAGADGLARLLRSAHEDEDVKALVVRVNSGGGGVMASEIIRDEIQRAKSKGINVVVSMGDVAASGGVWIATPAEYIFAEPTTITGSIGVAIAFPTFENTMDEIGIDFDGVVTTKNAGWDLNQAMTAEIKAAIQDDTAKVYNRFVSLVAESREESEDYIRTIAEGRVWIGTKALEINLVDEIGNFDDAVAKAAELAGIEEYEVDYFKETLDPEIEVLLELTESFDIKLIDQQTLNSFKSMTEILNEVLQVSKPTTLIACQTCEVALQ